MSNKRRKPKKKFQKPARPKLLISDQQQFRLQQAVQAQTRGDLVSAESEYRALIGQNVRTPQLYSNLALICAQSARPDEAHDLWVKALAIDPAFPDALMNLANSYSQRGEIDRATGLYRRVISAHPHIVDAKYLLANLHKSQGKLEQAAASYKQIMAQQPDYTPAHFLYSGIHKYRDKTDPHIRTMLALYESNRLAAEKKIHLAFALSKAFEDLKDYPQAFNYMAAGNRLRYATFNYRVDSDADLFANIIETFTREAISKLQVNAESSNKPIFVIGMPRSGTSLVEKILSSHSDVHGAGEIDTFYSLGANLFLNPDKRYQFDPLDSYPKDKFETLGKAYIEQIDLLDKQARRITDKLPFNFMMAGLIKIALPNAKIIHCTRDAEDNCLSIYKTNFATESYRFAYDLKTVGQFHNLYQMLMNHWHESMPGVIYDISYEALTQNPEHEIRELLSACDLEWQDSCLEFNKSAGLVKTASYYQVRQPMYTSSVKLWENYREFLAPLLEELNSR